jgi:hypothetical protein
MESRGPFPFNSALLKGCVPLAELRGTGCILILRSWAYCMAVTTFADLNELPSRSDQLLGAMRHHES